MNKYLKDSLKRQMQFITTSCAAYDVGQETKSLRVALSLRVIFHDTDHSTSILKQLGMKEFVRILSIAPEIVNKVPVDTDFAMAYPVIIGDFIRPNLEANRAQDLLTVSQWLKQRVMFNKKIWLTREDIISKAVNNDGGAHVDPRPNRKVQAMKTPWLIREVDELGQKKQELLTDNHFPILRAFGHEVLNSLDLTMLIK